MITFTQLTTRLKKNNGLVVGFGLKEDLKFSRYKVSVSHNLFTSVGFGLPNELCGRDSVENFTKKLRTLFRNENTAQLQ